MSLLLLLFFFSFYHIVYRYTNLYLASFFSLFLSFFLSPRHHGTWQSTQPCFHKSSSDNPDRRPYRIYDCMHVYRLQDPAFSYSVQNYLSRRKMHRLARATDRYSSLQLPACMRWSPLAVVSIALLLMLGHFTRFFEGENVKSNSCTIYILDQIRIFSIKEFS